MGGTMASYHQRDVWLSIRDYDYFGDGGQTLDDGVLDVTWNSNGGTLNGEEFSMRRNFYNKPLLPLTGIGISMRT